jgi:SagB-type dehydrogenase family enzyme
VGNGDIAATWAYHNGTKHSVTSVRSDPHFLDWEIMPRPFKVYPDLPPIRLPREVTGSSMRALDALGDCGEISSNTPIGLTQLTPLLYLSAGVLRRRKSPLGETYFRAAACTGNLHHIDLYLVAGDLTDLPAGVYQFAPHDLSLRRLRAGDWRASLHEAVASEPSVVGAPATLVLASTYWRNSWKYRARAYRHCFWDAGTLLANLLALAAARSIAARVVLGFVDKLIENLLDLDPAKEGALCVVALGRGAARNPPTAPGPSEPLHLPTLPLSPREIDYAAIREMHAASSLTSVKEVEAWRGPMASSLGVFPGTMARLEAADAPPEPIEKVIRRRGSTREFAHREIDRAVLATILHASTRGLSADFLEPRAQRAGLYVIVNAVTGLAPGAYVYDRERQALHLIREGEFRREAGYIALGQALGADSAACIYWLTELAPLLDRLGNRGYRAAQLEAAIGGGKVYLAAYAHGIGATGLTFFDDDVIHFFSPAANGRSVMFLAAIGHQA